jgi:hypothetical protein
MKERRRQVFDESRMEKCEGKIEDNRKEGTEEGR